MAKSPAPRGRSRSRTPSKATAAPSPSRSASRGTRTASKRVKEAVAAAAARSRTPRNPVTQHFEFSGPYLGPIGIIVGLPALVWGAAVYCGEAGWPAAPAKLPSWADVAATFSWEAMGVYVAWWLLQAALHVVVPGRVLPGVPLRDGSRLKYKVNGWACFLATHALLAAAHVSGVFKLTWVYHNFAQLATASILFSFGLSVYLYASSFRRRALLAEGGNSGIPLYDFFIGRELNPRIAVPGTSAHGGSGVLDLKYFCELRPGLFLWHLINVACAVVQWERTGALSPALVIVLVLQGLYVADSVYNEDCILTTIDIIQDGFGFMLAFGDLAWVPFMYSLQARFLVSGHAPALSGSLPYLAACAAVGVGGFYVFRAANAQKDGWKRDPTAPQFKGMPFVPSPTGSKLLAGGWWGTSRHINYLGDWLLSLGMSLPTAFVTPITYFYPVYFAVLLVHRELRDEHKCAAKYGAAWEQYKALVPYRIVPYVY